MMKIKKFLVAIACLLAVAGIAIGQNYDYHMSDLRVFRIDLGSDRAPTSGEVTTYGLLPGQFVVNAHNDTVYIVLDDGGDNVVKIETNGTLTVKSLSIDSLTDYTAVGSVYGKATAVNSSIASGQVIVTNTITMKDVGGSTIADKTLIQVWMSETAGSAPSTNNIETLVLSTGVAMETVTAHADYRYLTSTNGTAVAVITATAALTNYINIGVGPKITSTEIIFLP